MALELVLRYLSREVPTSDLPNLSGASAASLTLPRLPLPHSPPLACHYTHVYFPTAMFKPSQTYDRIAAAEAQAELDEWHEEPIESVESRNHQVNLHRRPGFYKKSLLGSIAVNAVLLMMCAWLFMKLRVWVLPLARAYSSLLTSNLVHALLALYQAPHHEQHLQCYNGLWELPMLSDYKRRRSDESTGAISRIHFESYTECLTRNLWGFIFC